tara:strand:- start:13233 stop:14303 length:1071 start_codon:yes stop_codon:yes gene_type:complete
MIRAYQQMAQPMLFLSGLFQSPPENFHTSEEVEIDIVRSDEDISIVIEDLSTGYRMNSEDLYTNKGFKPPIHKEAIPINSFDLLKRMPGQNPFESPDFRANVILRMFNGMTKIERKIRRSIEVQASQVLQTGVVTLTDINGAALYTLDYKPKATHFPTAGTAWGTAGDDPVGDINALAEVIRGDGLADPDQLLMGVDAFEAFIKNSDVQKRFDTRRFDLGTIAPMQMRGNGGSYRGTVEIGNYRYDVWTYGGRYKDPQTGVSTPYLDPSKVVVRASSGRLDATFGAIPNIGALMGTTANQLLPELPGRLSNAAGGMDLFTNAWTSQDGEQLFGGVGARPLMIPTAIDTFGCLETNA